MRKQPVTSSAVSSPVLVACSIAAIPGTTGRWGGSSLGRLFSDRWVRYSAKTAILGLASRAMQEKNLIREIFRRPRKLYKCSINHTAMAK